MKPGLPLHCLLEETAKHAGERCAVEEISGDTVTYAELASASDDMRDRLAHMGVSIGDRVGVFLAKSIDAVVSIFGILKIGAAYVPVDSTAPVSRNAFIFHDCQVKAVIVESRFAGPLRDEMKRLGSVPAMWVVERVGGGGGVKESLVRKQGADPTPVGKTVVPESDALAYILYTSGSTGRPKGVMISHRAARAFVDWCSDTFDPRIDDRFSSHAPFHFDLSILDIYVPIKHGATLVLIGSDLARDPVRLAPLIAEKKITCWYSAPSILGLLARHGNLADRDYSALRTVLFAGEVFPVVQLHQLKRLVPHPRYFNLYGPTETNVCTYYEIPTEIDERRTEPYPIGKVCPHYRARVVGPDGADVAAGVEGELYASGPGVMTGYWNLDAQTAEAFLLDADGARWYRTGDLVAEDESGDLLFRGRRDRMIKRRGYRIELGEIEACLYQYPGFQQVGVIALEGEEGVVIKAFVATADGARVSAIKLKRFCSERLPLYMVPDKFSFHQTLPQTSTDKIDYEALKELA